MRILVVDDDAMTRKMVTHVLRKDGHDVIDTANPVEAPHLTRKFTPDILVTDWSMPELSGIDLCQQIRDEFADDVSVVMLTAKTGNEAIRKARIAGAVAVISKPFNASALASEIRSLDKANAGPSMTSLQ